MDKGIRPYCNAKFAELNALRKAGTLTNTQFRKSVIAAVMEDFGITLASAATHYNHSFQEMKKSAPAEVEGLGRADDKKGGRKPKPKTDAAPANPILANFLAAMPKAPAATTPAATTPAVETTALETPAAVITDAAAAVGLEDLAPPATFTVVKAKDGSTVAEGLSREQADALVARAAAQKKAKLVILKE